VEKRLGALHGFLANVSPLIRARHLLPSDRQAELLSRIHEVLEATASSKDSRINWPVSPGQTPRFVQHCNGAPGVINCLAGFIDDPDTNSLLTGAGELIWDAGPLVKMPVLCHGTPGNGYAFLKLYALSGDERWLSRARSFAMHAIEQSEHALAQHRQRKYSLWTGDLGLAIYLWDCVRGTAGFPTLDVF